ncbi:MAG: NDP-sugar synthase [Candidatus Micrarchaeales archaeon]
MVSAARSIETIANSGLRIEDVSASSKSRSYGGIIVCGGRGTRIAELTGDKIPKPLLKIGGKELIRYSVDLMDPTVVSELVFAVDYMAEQIRAWSSAANLPHQVWFSITDKPGVALAVKEAAAFIEGDGIIFCNGDEIRQRLNLRDLIREHEATNAVATVVAAYSDKLHRRRVLEVDSDGLVVSQRVRDAEYASKPEEVGLANAGIMVMDKTALGYLNTQPGVNWDGIISPLIGAGKLRAYIGHSTRFFGINTAEEMREAEAYLLRNPSQ